MLFFTVLYRRTIRIEEDELVDRFGEEYTAYMERVPAVLPRLGEVKTGGTEDRVRGGEAGFRLGLFTRNREWEAGVGVAIGWGLLWLKMWWLS